LRQVLSESSLGAMSAKLAKKKMRELFEDPGKPAAGQSKAATGSKRSTKRRRLKVIYASPARQRPAPEPAAPSCHVQSWRAAARSARCALSALSEASDTAHPTWCESRAAPPRPAARRPEARDAPPRPAPQAFPQTFTARPAPDIKQKRLKANVERKKDVDAAVGKSSSLAAKALAMRCKVPLKTERDATDGAAAPDDDDLDDEFLDSFL
jgi:hypothetical protein